MEPTAELAVVSNATADEHGGRHNDELPVHRLPPEVLCNVFKHGHKKDDYRGLFAIRSVCKYWMDVVDSSPELWTFVSLEHNENLLEMVLQKSKNQLLSIYYDDGSWSDEDEFSSGRITRFLERTIPLVDRWKSLTYLVSPDADHDRILGLRFKSLELFKVHTDTIPSIYIKSLNAPKLRHVDLWGFSVNWRLLSNLRVFMVTGSTFGPGIDEVYFLLNTCPGLEILEIQGCVARSTPAHGSNLPSTPVFLPHLQYLLLFEVTVAPYSRLIPLIDAPNLRRLLLFRSVDPFEAYRPGNRFEPVQRFFGSYTHSLDNDPDHARFRISGSRSSFTISVGVCKMVVNYPLPWRWKDPRHDYLTQLSATLSGFDGRVSDSIKVIHFGGIRAREDLIILGPILQRHYPNVEELVVTLSSSEGRPDAHLVLEALASPLPLWGEARWLFPRLATLRLKACRESICDGVLAIIETRRNGGVQAIQRVSIKEGQIGRDTAAKLKACLQEFRMAGTRYVKTNSEESSEQESRQSSD